jgi:hypothetical protein
MQYELYGEIMKNQGVMGLLDEVGIFIITLFKA